MAIRLKRTFVMLCIFFGYCGQAFAASGASESPLSKTRWREPPACMQLDKQYELPCLQETYQVALRHTIKGEHDRAIARYTQVINVTPAAGRVYSNRGVSYAEIGNWKLAREDFTHAIFLSPEIHQHWTNIAYLDFREKHFERALRAASHAIQIAPNVIDGIALRAKIYRVMNRISLAKIDEAKVKAIRESSPDTSAIDSGTAKTQ